jgi:hypothetical protein
MKVFILGFMALSALVSLAVPVALIWIVLHFVLKFW